MKKHILFYGLIGLSAISFAQTSIRDSTQSPGPNKLGDAEKKIIGKVGNPWNSSTSLNLHNYYTSKLQNTTESGNVFLLRGLITSKRHLVRATLPFVSTPTKQGYKSGIANLNIFDAIRFTGDSSHLHMGVGPFVSIPTATKAVAGIGQWQLGAVAMGVHASEKGAILGALVIYRHSIGSSNDQMNDGFMGGFLSIQPVLLLNMGNGLYARSFGTTAIFGFKNNSALVPLGIGIGKYFKVGNTAINIFIEPGYTVYSKGENVPAYQMLVGMDFVWFKHKK